MNEEFQTCSICDLEISKQLFVQLTCTHEFCKNCLVFFCNEKIKTNDVSPSALSCPHCKTKINFYIIKENVPGEIFQRYEELLLKNVELENKDKEITINCPKCNTLNVIWKDADYFTCPNCHDKWCSKPNCYGNWKQHEALSCTEYQKKFDTSNEEKFRLLLQQQGWKQCPVCFSVIEKIKDCNTVRCSSDKCQKKTIFCYLCGEKLTEGLKGSINKHFPKGELNRICVNSQIKEEEKENNIPCEISAEKKICCFSSCFSCLKNIINRKKTKEDENKNIFQSINKSNQKSNLNF